ncbi:MAG: lysophospholipid acyltransferase family protein [Alloprevotella sp.]|nr:lysophospholipid acyltransferase family protein [Prevotella sp.]MBR1712756.1 lysophospholipid acyltransferase family protein [Alloprevotella sp.]
MKRVVAYLVEKFFTLSSLLPTPLHYFLASLLYPIIYYAVRYRRSVVRSNIERSFPEKTQAEQRAIERGFYRFFCDYIVETCRLLTIPEREIRRRMTFDGIREMEDALADHDFVFIYLGHYCNWEWISTLPLWVNKKYHCAQLYRPLNNEGFETVFMRLRTRFGAENIAKSEALRRILALKSQGQKSIIGFISDQSPQPINIHDWVDFLHQDTPVFTGTERIAKKVDAAAFFADVQRLRRGYYHCTFRPLSTNVRKLPDYQLTELYMYQLEEIIRRQPSLWLWSHKRWKHQRPISN